MNPEFDPAHNLFGIVNAALGNNEQAEKSFNEAIRLAPENDEYKQNLQRLKSGA